MTQIDYAGLFDKGDAFFEACITHLYQGLLVPGDLAVDGGAHVGAHTIPLAQCVGPQGLVVAIEPLPHLAAYLKDRLRQHRFGNVVIAQTALGAAHGTTEFHWVTNAEAYSGVRPRDYPEGATIQKIQVPIVPLDRLLDAIGRVPRFVKLDLEGGEFMALKGARNMLLMRESVIVFENARAWTCKYWDYDKTDFFTYFNDVGYDLTDLFLRPLVPETWDANPWPWYFIATPAGSALKARVADRLLPFLMRSADA